MLAILIFLNAHNLLIFQPIVMTFVSKFMFQKALSDKTYLSLGLLSPLMKWLHCTMKTVRQIMSVVTSNLSWKKQYVNSKADKS